MLPHAALLSAVYAGMRHRTMSFYSATVGPMTSGCKAAPSSCSPFIMQPGGAVRVCLDASHNDGVFHTLTPVRLPALMLI